MYNFSMIFIQMFSHIWSCFNMKIYSNNNLNLKLKSIESLLKRHCIDSVIVSSPIYNLLWMHTRPSVLLELKMEEFPLISFSLVEGPDSQEKMSLWKHLWADKSRSTKGRPGEDLNVSKGSRCDRWTLSIFINKWHLRQYLSFYKRQ